MEVGGANTLSSLKQAPELYRSQLQTNLTELHFNGPFTFKIQILDELVHSFQLILTGDSTSLVHLKN